MKNRNLSPNEKRKNTRDTAILGVAAALCLVLSYIEFLLPPVYAALPAVKFGLANVTVVFALYRLGKWRALLLAAVKVALTAFLFGSVLSLAYSAAGALLSLLTMMLLKKTGRFSPVGVSVAGGVAHNVGQIITAVAFFGRPEIAYYLPILIISGTLSGILVGLCGGIAVKRVK